MPSSKVLIGTASAVMAAVGTTVFSMVKKAKEEQEVLISIPEWAVEYHDSLKDTEFTSDEEMMEVAIELSRSNVADSGGPFGAAIFENDTATGKSKLFAVGANRVVPLGNSTLHAEMVAIQFAQKKLKSFSLGPNADTGKEYYLFTSCEPCAMCLGATLWSGVSRLACSATKDDAEAIGFNEGPVFPASYSSLESSGCKVVKELLQDKGAEVLQNYGKAGLIY